MGFAGLTTQEAHRRHAAEGPNVLVEPPPPSALAILVSQFTNTMTALLAAAAVVTLIVGDVKDTVVIAAIVIANAAVGFGQEHAAQRAVAALKQMTAGTSTVIRDGRTALIPTAELVTGDLVVLAAGDVVPADLRLVQVHSLRVNESALTGEAEPASKEAAPQGHDDGDGSATDRDRATMAFNGTAVAYGRAEGIVIAIGMQTELGRIASLLEARSAPTPLERRLASLARRMAAAALVVCASVFVAGVASGETPERMFLTAVSLAVAAVPEGLPAIVTVALALGARRMSAHHAIVRRLPAVETLGSVSVICTDKTGTLTENRMMVERVWTPYATYSVTGEGYAPNGAVDAFTDLESEDPFLLAVAEVAAACNDATIHPPARPAAEWTATGDPTEAALLALAAKLGVDHDRLEHQRPRVAEIAFDAGRRRMTTVHEHHDAWWVATKGALGALASVVDGRSDGALSEATRVGDGWAASGYRVLALADRTSPPVDDVDALEHGLRLVGLVAIADQARAEAAPAVAACRGAGITPVMVTGDDPRTARAIATRVGLLDADDEAPDAGEDERVMTGAELDAVDDERLHHRIQAVRVFARTSPEQKLRIIDGWKHAGAIVAMTGDGVNDSPALQRADIGVAMGLAGTEVSKQAADMVLTDDNFATIVHAVEEGRRIYDNIRRVVRYLLTTNSGELWVMFLAPLFGLPIPLLPIQILWINLVTDGLPAVALGLESAEPETMRRPPRHPRESILAGGLWQHAVVVGLLMAAVVLPLQFFSRRAGWPWQTMVFTTLALLQLGNAAAVRSEWRLALTMPYRSNPWVVWALIGSALAQLATVYVPPFRDVFRTAPLTIGQLAVVAAASTVVFFAVEAEKVVRRNYSRARWTTSSAKSRPS